jgi:hypothetical protein
MQIISAPTPNLILGFDCYAPVSSETAAAAVRGGYVFAVRYVDNLSAQEITTVLDAGLALMLVKQAPAKISASNSNLDYTPTAGTSDGHATVALAQGLEIPAGMCIFVDAESIHTSKSDATGYLKNWYSAVAQAGYVPGIYVGTTMFSATELYKDFGFQHYWQAGISNMPFVDSRGYQLYQQGQAKINEHTVDIDYAQADLRGGKLLWLSKTAS